MNSVSENVQKYTEIFKEKWNRTSVDVSFLKKQEKRARSLREKKLDRGLDEVFSLFDDFPEKEPEKSERTEKLKSTISALAKAHLGIKNKEFEKEMLSGIMDVTDRFISQARDFDPETGFIDIMQAMRNVWIMNIIQMIAGKKPEYTPSIFAYSMLYPYTDNYLDSPDISLKDKEEFNRRLALRINGDKVKPLNALEEKIFSLIATIEGQYPREKYPEVFGSVLSIQQGQIKSLSQQTASGCSENDILCISAEKGGTSVLADAYLVCGKLDDSFVEFNFGYGFMLQLIDDLQDAAEDSKNSHTTIFSDKVGKVNFDGTVSRLINFVAGALDYKNASTSPYISDIEQMITDNCILMIFQAVSKNKRFFSRRYLKFARERSAISFRYFTKMERKIKRKMKEPGMQSIIG